MLAPTPSRRGVLLLLVSGIAVMLLTLSLTFLARMRANAGEAAEVLATGQARAALHAALCYIAETSRLGWHRDAAHSRTWGWTDVRDGSVGPRYDDGSAAWAPGVWPAPGTAMRAPLYVMAQPPYAVAPRFAHNPVAYDLGYKRDLWRQASFARPDPVPLGGFASGDPTPRLHTLDRAWFRLYREAPGDHDGSAGGPSDPDGVDFGDDHGIFIVTCGAGGTMGYRSAAEAPAGTFGGDATAAAELFARLRADEQLLWYRVAWSAWAPDVAGQQGRWDRKAELRPLPPLSGLDPTWNDDNSRAAMMQMAPFGTFRFIQRLDREPPRW